MPRRPNEIKIEFHILLHSASLSPFLIYLLLTSTLFHTLTFYITLFHSLKPTLNFFFSSPLFDFSLFSLFLSIPISFSIFLAPHAVSCFSSFFLSFLLFLSSSYIFHSLPISSTLFRSLQLAFTLVQPPSFSFYPLFFLSIPLSPSLTFNPIKVGGSDQ